MIALRDGLLLAGNLLPKGFDLRARCALRREANRAALQSLADELADRYGGEFDRRYEGAHLRHNRKQVLFYQALNDLADGRAADTVLLGKPRLGQSFARPQPPA